MWGERHTCTAVSLGDSFLLVCLFFRAVPTTYGGSQARGPIGAAAADFRYSHSNARSFTHWARPGIELGSSRILVGFVNC